MAENESQAKNKTLRSPNYPYIDLSKAVDLAKKLYDKYKTLPTAETLVAECWDYSPTSSGTQRVVGALLDYGLVNVRPGKGAGGREIEITENARRVVLKADGYEGILANMAISPPVYNDLWGKYGSETLSESHIRHYLMFERKFNDDSAKNVTGSFIRTINFANPSKFIKLSNKEGAGEDSTDNADVSSGNSAKEDQTAKSQETSKSFSPPKVNMNDTQEMKFPLSKGREAILFVPKEMSGKDFNLLMGYLKLAENASLASEEDSEG